MQTKSSRETTRSVFNCLVLLLVLLSYCRSNAQVVGATVSGTVTDPSGAAIPQAQISIENLATGVSAVFVANSDGFYMAPNLLPGRYEIRATASGFATEVRSGITLTVGAQQVMNLTLTLGQTSQTIEVTGEAPSIDLMSSAISAVINSNTVVGLPLNGRSWTDLTTLQPGVNVIPTQPDYTSGSDRANRGFGIQLTISGGRPVQNNYRLNGISMNDYANAGPGSVIGGNLGVDAIQEFSVLTTNYSAEYGKTSGGVINAISRSGTNQFHGDAYEFLRNSALDARNFFDPPQIPPFRRNQFGASGGGPIRKNRAFFFVDYEGIRQAKGVSTLDLVPSQAARLGNLCSAPSTPGACTPMTVTVDPSAQKYFTFFPIPNSGPVPGSNGDVGFFDYSANQIVGENFFTTRIDDKLSDKDSVFGSYMIDRAKFSSPDSLDDSLFGISTARQLVTLEEDHVFSHGLVNTVRFGYNRDVADSLFGISAINPAAADSSYGAFPGANATSVQFGGSLTSFGGGFPRAPDMLLPWNSFQGYDDAFFTRGTHSLKFGFAVERMQLNIGGGADTGTFHFDTIADFLANRPSELTVVLNDLFPATLGGASRDLRQTLFGGYLQDDWRLRHNLTLNLGLRYEMTTDETDAHNKLAVLANFTDATPQLGGPLFSNNTLRNFEPRVGFAWDPFSHGKTSVRGGFGMFDVLPLIYENMITQFNVAPFTSKSITTPIPPGSFFAGAAAIAAQPTSLTAQYIEQHPHRSYVMQWNLNVQQQITPNMTAMVGFVGSRGVHIPFFDDDGDMAIPTLTSAGYLWPAPIGSGTRINSNFGSIHTIFFKGNSFYDALQATVSKRMSHGLQFETSFTWGRSIDNDSASGQGDQFGNSISSEDWFAPNLTRAVSDFNVGRTLVLNLTWQVPNTKSLPAPASWLANGWQLAGIFTASDGVPFTPTWGTGSDPAGTLSSDNYAFPDRLTTPGCATLVNPGNPNNYIKTQCFTLPTAPNMAFWQANCDTTSNIYGPTLTPEPFPVCFNLRGNAGRNILTGPGLTNLDFSMIKDNFIKRVSETFNVQFRTELFNVLNHPNFQPPHTANAEADVFDATGVPISSVGILTRTSTDSREIQFALKFIW